jgi:hypothetical protein
MTRKTITRLKPILMPGFSAMLALLSLTTPSRGGALTWRHQTAPSVRTDRWWSNRDASPITHVFAS